MVGYTLSLTLHKHIDTLMLRTCMLEHVLFSVSTITVSGISCHHSSPSQHPSEPLYVLYCKVGEGYVLDTLCFSGEVAETQLGQLPCTCEACVCSTCMLG